MKLLHFICLVGVGLVLMCHVEARRQETPLERLRRQARSRSTTVEATAPTTSDPATEVSAAGPTEATLQLQATTTTTSTTQPPPPTSPITTTSTTTTTTTTTQAPTTTTTLAPVSIVVPKYKCANGTFDCGNGQCIPRKWRCNGWQDCDNSDIDERNCASETSMFKCPPNQFRCDGSYHCIKIGYVCDGDRDCGTSDPSDEITARCDRRRSNWNNFCRDPNSFRCRSTGPSVALHGRSTTAECIPFDQLCDTHRDCSDGTDEDEEFCIYNSNCPDDHGCDHKCTLYRNQSVCSCDLGWEMDPLDHRKCRDIDECASYLNQCSHQCINEDGGYRCECADGYTLAANVTSEIGINSVNRSCLVNDGAASFVFLSKLPPSSSGMTSRVNYKINWVGKGSRFADGVDIRHEHWTYGMRLGSSYEDLAYNADSLTVSWFDVFRHRIAILSLSSKSIRYLSIKYPGMSSGVVEPTLLVQGFPISAFKPPSPRISLEHMRWDWINSHWYFIMNGTIIVACRESSSKTPSPQSQSFPDYLEEITSASSPSGSTDCTTVYDTLSRLQISTLALAPPEGFLFWATSSLMGHGGEIFRMAMSGHIDSIKGINNKCTYPYSLVVELPTRRIYWADRAYTHLFSVDYDGLHERLIGVGIVKHPILMRVFEDFIYMIHNTSSPLMRANKRDASGRIYLSEYGLVSPPVSMEIAHKSLQPKIANPCVNSSCRGHDQMCLIHNATHHSCMCRWGYTWNVTLANEATDELASGEEFNYECVLDTALNSTLPDEGAGCKADTCKNNGACMVTRLGAMCWCENGFTGLYCQTAPKVVTTTVSPGLDGWCENEGRWVAENNTCDCAVAYYGDRCELRESDDVADILPTEPPVRTTALPVTSTAATTTTAVATTTATTTTTPSNRVNSTVTASERSSVASHESSHSSASGWIIGILVVVIVALLLGLVWTNVFGNGRTRYRAPSVMQSTASMAQLDLQSMD